jgi:hypothetical protein
MFVVVVSILGGASFYKLVSTVCLMLKMHGKRSAEPSGDVSTCGQIPLEGLQVITRCTMRTVL